MNSQLRIFNTLSNTEEAFEPINADQVGLYTCGPTVYHYVTIGNWRTYILGDLVNRVLRYNGHPTKYIMNITDVGHLTGDNEGDASQGEDRMEKAKRREGKDAWQIAQLYTDDFLAGFKAFNLIEPEQFTKATDHIAEQIALVQELEKNNFTYKISDGIYFDVSAYEAAGHDYGQLSTLDHSHEGQARIAPNPEKRDPRDFALWKFSPTDTQRDMEWESPWGVGFPGWHVECSAMSMKYLGKSFDIHIGGEDLRQTHHPNEIAQSEGATGEKPFVKYWMHGAFLLIDGGKMGKSLGNAYTLHDLNERGFSALDFKYFLLQSHYLTKANFTWDALAAAKQALGRLYGHVRRLADQAAPGDVSVAYRNDFMAAINDNLNLPAALALVWKLLKDDALDTAEKLATLYDFDRVLGLDIQNQSARTVDVPDTVRDLAEKRQAARASKDWTEADQLRDEIAALGYEVLDTDDGYTISSLS